MKRALGIGVGFLVLIALIITVTIIIQQGSASSETTPTSANATNTASGGATRDTMPPFSLTRYDGTTIRSSELSEPVLVINVWATWCPFCTDELPAFAKLQEQYPDDVRVIAINRGESVTTAKTFTDARDITQDLTYLMDPDDQYYRRIGGISMPETLFVGPDRTIRIHKRGPMEFTEMKKKIEQILKTTSSTD